MQRYGKKLDVECKKTKDFMFYDILLTFIKCQVVIISKKSISLRDI